MFNASVSQQNVLGSGNALSLAVNTSSYNTLYSFIFTEPYWTVDGVSRTLELYYRRTDPSGQAISQYASTVGGAAIGFGVPVTESDTVNFGLRVERTDLSLFDDSPPLYLSFVRQYGNPTWNFVGTVGWARDTRDDVLYPTRGRLQSAFAELGMPPGDLQYYRINYLHQWFWPVYGDFVLMVRGDFGYADGYNQPACPPPLLGEEQYCASLPFFKNFYGGGVGSVRGYESNSLGPLDIFGNVLGGRRKIVGNAELVYPIFKGDKSVRGSVFFDVGQIWASELAAAVLGQHRELRRRAVDRPRGRLPRVAEFPLLGGRRAGVELADRSAQVQLRLPDRGQVLRPHPAVPIPGRQRVLTVAVPRRRPS